MSTYVFIYVYVCIMYVRICNFVCIFVCAPARRRPAAGLPQENQNGPQTPRPGLFCDSVHTLQVRILLHESAYENNHKYANL